MKKQLLALALLGMGIANAQTWSENFTSTSAQALPAGWLQNNVDGFTVASNLSSFGFGSNAWVTNAVASEWPNQGRVVMSTSWYSPAGVANDWLITPSFTVPPGASIQWEATSVETGYEDGYQVKISTTGTTVGSFATNLLTIPAETMAATSTSPWTERSISLNTYSNQTVRIAFVNNSNDMNRLYLDNIQVIIPAANDGNVVSITSVPRYTVAGNTTISGIFKNKGSAVANNATMNYQVDAGPIVTQTITLAALAYNQTGVYTFTAPAALTLGTHTVSVWVTQVNGVNETNTVNDLATTISYVASQSSLMNALVEEWSSSTCGPCASLNSSFDPLLNGNTPNSGGRVNVIKYQVDWPSPNNDPSFNLHADQRVLYYGINAAPTAIVGGDAEMSAHSQAEIDAGKNEPAYGNITATLNVVGSTVTGTATITPFLTIASGSPIRIHQALIQKDYSFANPSTSQQNFFHVMRQMYPDGNGASVTVADGVPQTVSFNHNVNTVPIYPPLAAQNSNNFWTTSNQVYEYVVFMQDDVTGQILQSGSANSVIMGLAKLSKDARIGVYPNPAKDFAVVGIRLNSSSTVDITIYDVTGKVVYVNKGAQVQQGEQEIRINTTEFANGTYNIMVNTNEGTLKDKLIISK
ncbi:MAG: choice-of-anchor J domain-containing protein [Sphingobacteriaceae bacterium]|nr:choice-of-anchor J domain-containing protein [Sphingobacteriaceae bacterium]